ncbi:hypothetical protein [Corynebacterium lizhenjunii]|uniref:hypothetical protein n=1 Tax=Corynebacterium lizhenjunii TaxID=2709394 RepID=UPI0013ED7CE9|nr:hypothetical protein [Corynebacterium lizhenjunii]
MEEFYTQAPGVGFYPRDFHALQCGVDATRAGIIEITPAPLVAQILQGLVGPVRAEEFSHALESAGLSKAAADSLFEELVRFGVWVPVTPRDHIFLVGSSPLATLLAGALRADDFLVHQPRRGTQLQPFLALARKQIPVVVVDQWSEVEELSTLLHRTTHTWLPVAAFDTRVLLGPAHINGQGPCPLCFGLYRTELDPLWAQVTNQISPVPEPDIVVGAAAIAHTVVAVRSLVGRPSLPGALPVLWSPGRTDDVDVHGRTQQHFFDPHPRCPACFNADTADAPGNLTPL